MNRRIGIVGCGNMGEAIIRQNPQFIVFDKDAGKLKKIYKSYNVNLASDNKDLIKRSAIIIIAVKPQSFDEVLEDIRASATDQLIISIAAGISTKYIENYLGRKIRVVRVMPNIAVLVRSGLSAVCKGKFATEEDARIAERIFNKLGKVVSLKENQIDSFTAIAGSGPAYFFYFIEALSRAGKNLGFSETESIAFVKQVAKGSFRLLEETGFSAGQLREKVTSKKGTTEAALSVFKREGFNEIIRRALIKAVSRAKELSRH